MSKKHQRKSVPKGDNHPRFIGAEVSDDFYQKVRQAAQADGRSVSSWLRRQIILALGDNHPVA